MAIPPTVIAPPVAPGAWAGGPAGRPPSPSDKPPLYRRPGILITTAVTVLIVLISAVAGSMKKSTSTTATTTATTATSATAASPTTTPAPTSTPTTATPATSPPKTVPAAPKSVLSFTGSGDKSSTNFIVGDTWQLSWVVHASTTPTVEINDASGTTIDHVDTGKSGSGSTIEHQACTCYVKVTIFGDTTYSFTVTDLPGGAPTAAAPVTFSASSDKTTTNFTVSSPWTLSWTVQASTTPTVEVFDGSGTSIDHVDTGRSGSGSTIERARCPCYLKVAVFVERHFV